MKRVMDRGHQASVPATTFGINSYAKTTVLELKVLNAISSLFFLFNPNHYKTFEKYFKNSTITWSTSSRIVLPNDHQLKRKGKLILETKYLNNRLY